MEMAEKQASQKTGFILLLIAAVIYFLLDGGLLLDFLWELTYPVGHLGMHFFLVANILFVLGLIIINGLFQEGLSRTLNLIVVIGAVPSFVVYILYLADVKADFFFGVPLYITESFFFLVLLVGAYNYYQKDKSSFRLILLITFAVFFVTIALWYIGLNLDFITENPDYYSAMLKMLGFGISISSLSVIGCAIHFFTQENGEGKVAAPQGAQKAGASRFCTACGASLEGNEKFCPGCGAKVAGREEV